mmetsp:Transcript_11723/g.27073  ORF Transcript_11723/g.27073 Transcript_11723/m.27073 type:complete len:111 (-) Transcript_11723:32-364(-)
MGSLEAAGKFLGPLLALLSFERTAAAGHASAIFFISALVLVPGVLVAFRLHRFMKENAGRRREGSRSSRRSSAERARASGERSVEVAPSGTKRSDPKCPPAELDAKTGAQ